MNQPRVSSINIVSVDLPLRRPIVSAVGRYNK